MSRRILFWASFPLMVSPLVSVAMPAAAVSAYSQQTLPGIESASNSHNSTLLADLDVRYQSGDWDHRDRDDYYRYRRDHDRDWERWHRDRDWDRRRDDYRYRRDRDYDRYRY